ncbi:unnamed protein product, partial [Mesorhabditis spiculigera]
MDEETAGTSCSQQSVEMTPLTMKYPHPPSSTFTYDSGPPRPAPSAELVIPNMPSHTARDTVKGRRRQEIYCKIPRWIVSLFKYSMLVAILVLAISGAFLLIKELLKAPEITPPLQRNDEPISILMDDRFALGIVLIEGQLIVTFADTRPTTFQTSSYDEKLVVHGNTLTHPIPHAVLDYPCEENRVVNAATCCTVPAYGITCLLRSEYGKWTNFHLNATKTQFYKRGDKYEVLVQERAKARPMLLEHNGTKTKLHHDCAGDGFEVAHWQMSPQPDAGHGMDILLILYEEHENGANAVKHRLEIWDDPRAERPTRCVHWNEQLGLVEGIWLNGEHLWLYHCTTVQHCIIEARIAEDLRVIYNYPLNEKKRFVWSSSSSTDRGRMVGVARDNVLSLFSYTNNLGGARKETRLWRETFHFNK